MPDSPNQETMADTAHAWAVRWGLLLRMARQVEGLSLANLAARTGLSKGYLSKLESAHHSAANPSRATLAALARALPATVSLIWHLAPEEGLPTARSLVGVEGRATVRQVEALRLSRASAPAGVGQPEEAKGEALAAGWLGWEVLLAVMLIEGAGFGPPTQAVLARACRVEGSLAALLGELEQGGALHRLAPAWGGGPARYTLEGARLEQAGITRPAHLFMQAAMQLLSGAALSKEERHNDA